MNNQNKYILKFIKYNFLFYLLFFIIIIYIIVYYLKHLNNNYETFTTLLNSNDNDLLNLNNFNNKIVFISGNNSSFNSIYDKFYVYNYDNICFNQNLYEEQGKLVIKMLNPLNIYVQKILMLDVMTGHVYGTLYNLPCNITLSNSNNELCNSVKKKYTNADIISLDMLTINNTHTNNNYTCITNFSNNFYYYNNEELNKYFYNIQNILVSKGLFIVNYIIDFKNISVIHGSINKNKNNLFFLNYYYKLNILHNKNNTIIEEIISPLKNKNKKKINKHIFFNYNKKSIIDIANKNNFELIHQVYQSKYKDNYGFLIFRKI